MFAWKPYTLTVGMPHMVPERLSEVELYKWLGAFQWESIADLVGVPSARIVNEDGERLYASFIDIELSMGGRAGGGPLGLQHVDEGSHLHLVNGTRVHARTFVEGLYLLDTQPVDDGVLAGIRDRADLEATGRPWVSMDNAFVARFGGENDRLKVFAPAGLEKRDVPEAADRPPGITEHGQVQASGQVEARWDVEGFRPLPLTDSAPVVYDVVPESDLNGAGLVYFARFVAMMDYGERVHLTQRIGRPLSRQLVPFLTTQRRRLFYFANAQPWDQVKVRVWPRWRRTTDATGRQDMPRFRAPLELDLRIDLHRASDGVLMASSRVLKRLVVPAHRKAVLSEAERFLGWLEAMPG